MSAVDIQALGVGSLGGVAVIYAVFVFIIHVLLAFAANGDAKRLRESGGGLFLVGPFLWGWVVFIFGIAGLALYWAVHHSALREMRPPQARVDKPNAE